LSCTSNGREKLHELRWHENQIRKILTLTLIILSSRTVNTDGFKPNLETHLAPVLATQIKTELLGKSELGSQIEGGNGATNSSKKPHHPLLLEVTYITSFVYCDFEASFSY